MRELLADAVTMSAVPRHPPDDDFLQQATSCPRKFTATSRAFVGSLCPEETLARQLLAIFHLLHLGAERHASGGRLAVKKQNYQQRLISLVCRKHTKPPKWAAPARIPCNGEARPAWSCGLAFIK